jgi:deoxycytidylate deaminase
MTPRLIDIALDAPTDESTVLIEEEEYEAALRDPKVRALHAEADALLERFEREGRNVSF